MRRRFRYPSGGSRLWRIAPAGLSSCASAAPVGATVVSPAVQGLRRSKRVGAGWRSPRRYAGGERPVSPSRRVRPNVFAAPVVIGADGRGRVDLTREGMGCAYGRTATRWRIASGLVAAGVLLLHNSATQCASKSPPSGVVEHVVLRSHRDNVKPMARMRRGVAGPRCAESMLRERGANNQCRGGQPYAAAGTRPRWRGDDWRQADSRCVWPWLLRTRVGDRQQPSEPVRAARVARQRSGLSWTMSARPCAQGLLTAECPVGRACRLTDLVWFGCMLVVAVRRPIRSCCAAP